MSFIEEVWLMLWLRGESGRILGPLCMVIKIFTYLFFVYVHVSELDALEMGALCLSMP